MKMFVFQNGGKGCTLEISNFNACLVPRILDCILDNVYY